MDGLVNIDHLASAVCIGPSDPIEVITRNCVVAHNDASPGVYRITMPSLEGIGRLIDSGDIIALVTIQGDGFTCGARGNGDNEILIEIKTSAGVRTNTAWQMILFRQVLGNEK